MTQKGDLYTEMFSTVSAAKAVLSTLSQLNILCTHVMKLHCPKIAKARSVKVGTKVAAPFLSQLVQRIFKYGYIKTNSLTRDDQLNIFICRTPS